MKKPRHVLVALLGLWVFPFSVHAASASITELMYDLPGADTGREWVEIQNTGSEPVSFLKWKLFEGGTNHGLSFFRGAATTSPGGFAVIADEPAKFLSDWPQFAGTLFASSFSLSNSGETLALKLDGAVVDEVTYASTTGAAGDGYSLQKTATLWQALLPTPGAAAGQATTPHIPPQRDAGQVSGTASVSPAGASSNGVLSPIEPKIFVGMSAPATALAGADVLFEATAVGLKKEPLQNARYLWSFGDGGSAEGKRVLHPYHYPGTYVVLVEASSGEWSATERQDMRVAAPTISIPRFKEGPEGFIEVENSGPDDLDLSRWFLQSGSEFFAFPKGTILPAQKTIPFAAAITKLGADPNDTAVLYPNGTLAVRYEPKEKTLVVSAPVPATVPKPEAIIEKKPTAEPALPSEPRELQAAPDSTVVSSSELVAAVGEARGGAIPWMLGVAALVVVSIGGFVLVSRMPQKEPTGVEKLSREAEKYDLVE